MILPEGLKQAFWDELRTYEEERTMPYITSVEQIGIEKGIEKGERSLILRLLKHKFGELPDLTLQQINALSTRKLGSLGEALLDFATIDDLQDWLKSHKSRRSTKS
jgi:Domain of unknown function (DUF4351)